MRSIVCMPALEYLKAIDPLPMTMHGNEPRHASNSERRRWLQSRSVIINGDRPGPDDLVEMPVTELVFFPSSPRRCTMLQASSSFARPIEVVDTPADTDATR